MSPFLDGPVGTKLKLCALWTSVMFCSIYAEVYRLYIPGALERMKAFGVNQELHMLWMWIAIPILMIFLSVALPAKYNRALNIAIGVLIFLSVAIVKVGTLILVAKVGGPPASPSPFRDAAVLLETAIAAFAALVVWYAWKWPRTPNAV
jgi:hypothetical protein